MNKLLIFFTLLIIGCSHHEKPAKSYPEIEAFLEEWKTDYGYNDGDYIRAYRPYLISVLDIYDRANLSSKFENYLTSIKNNSQVLAHTEYSLPQRFRKERKGRWINYEYQLYKDKILGEIDDKLNHDRWETLRRDLGDEVFQKLIENKQSFIESNNRKFVNFPL